MLCTDDFFRGGDLRSAINAYSSALDMDEQMLGCIANRSVCYLKLNMPFECKADCTAGIAIIENGVYPEAEVFANTCMLIKLLLRRATVGGQLGLFNDALDDLRSVHSEVSKFSETSQNFSSGALPSGLLPNGVTTANLDMDISRLERIVLAEKLKKEGDSLFSEKNLNAAIENYTKALSLVPYHVSCLSNRSACFLAIGRHEDCLTDCDLALEYLSLDTSAVGVGVHSAVAGAKSSTYISGMNAVAAILPPVGSEKRKSWTLKTLTRRGATHSLTGNLQSAIKDFSKAVAMDPSNEALKSDLNKLMIMKENKALKSS